MRLLIRRPKGLSGRPIVRWAIEKIKAPFQSEYCISFTQKDDIQLNFKMSYGEALAFKKRIDKVVEGSNDLYCKCFFVSTDHVVRLSQFINTVDELGAEVRHMACSDDQGWYTLAVYASTAQFITLEQKYTDGKIVIC